MITDLGLGAGRIYGLGKLVCFNQSLGKSYAADRTVLLITLKTASGDVSAYDALDGKHLKLPAHHAPALKVIGSELFGHICGISGYHMVRDYVLGQFKPELRHLCQHFTLFRYHIVQDHVETADPVGGHHDKCVVVIVDLADFSFFDRCGHVRILLSHIHIIYKSCPNYNKL